EVDAVRADDRDDQDGGHQPAVGDAQQVHEQTDQRQVQNQQHHVADIHAGDQSPEHFRVVGEQQRPRRDPVNGERRQQDGGGRDRRNAEREQRDHGGAGGGVVGGLRRGHALDGALAEPL